MAHSLTTPCIWYFSPLEAGLELVLVRFPDIAASCWFEFKRPHGSSIKVSSTAEKNASSPWFGAVRAGAAESVNNANCVLYWWYTEESYTTAEQNMYKKIAAVIMMRSKTHWEIICCHKIQQSNKKQAGPCCCLMSRTPTRRVDEQIPLRPRHPPRRRTKPMRCAALFCLFTSTVGTNEHLH